ncbi:hypothetical protein [Halanaerobium salsuginis]|uniref:Uncharacterized protein n=1 Tax=Halanaerobium salsuginis TaxID=29563 RepID=A0A1I4IZK1_9FIRM|nr:hypothetical protein [Halanaerobium salsuginis]SFL59186.1 hypothetical protein SAMN02983006_01552 [Halanaerobium salsuginis]
MKNIFKDKRTHKSHKNRFNYSVKSETEEHIKRKDSALMDYYMMGGY